MESLSTLFPTDNLYKFFSITGLIVLAFSILYPEIRSDEVQKKLIDLKGKYELLKYRQEVILAEQKEMNSFSEGLIKKQKKQLAARKTSRIQANEYPNTDIEDYQQLLKDLKNKNEREYFEFKIKYNNDIVPNQKEINNYLASIDKQKLVGQQLDLKSIELSTVEEAVKLEVKKIDYLMALGLIGKIIGLIMAFFGFALWYFLHQKLQDEIINFQVEEYRQKLKTKDEPLKTD
jgi:hypothetical protein